MKTTMNYYILKDRRVLATKDVMKWARCLADAQGRIVAQTMLVNKAPWIGLDTGRIAAEVARAARLGIETFGPVTQLRTHATRILISTVFIGIDHNFRRDGPPLTFETMVFNGPLNEEQRRWTTWDEAEAGHVAMVDLVKTTLLERGTAAR